MENIFENDTIKVLQTGNDFDFIATIENKTDKEIRIIFDDEDVENFSVPPNDWVGVLADEEGYFSLNEIKSHAFNVMENL